MSNTREVICPACGDNIEVSFYYEKAHGSTWGYSGGTPPEPEILEIEGDVICPNCGHEATELEIEVMEDSIFDQFMDEY